MTMKTEPATARTCMTCQTAETDSTLECPRCRAIGHAINGIKQVFYPDEIEGLARNLKTSTMSELIENAKERKTGALLKILYRIRDMAYLAKIDADSMRLAVVRKIHEQLEHQANVRKYEEEEGEPGIYMKRSMAYIGKYVEELKGGLRA